MNTREGHSWLENLHKRKRCEICITLRSWRKASRIGQRQTGGGGICAIWATMGLGNYGLGNGPQKSYLSQTHASVRPVSSQSSLTGPPTERTLLYSLGKKRECGDMISPSWASKTERTHFHTNTTWTLHEDTIGGPGIQYFRHLSASSIHPFLESSSSSIITVKKPDQEPMGLSNFSRLV